MRNNFKIKEIIEIAEIIASFPSSEEGITSNVYNSLSRLANIFKVDNVEFFKTGDRVFLTFKEGEDELGYYAGRLLRSFDNFKATVTFALINEFNYYNNSLEYATKNTFFRLNTVSSLFGFELSYNSETPLDEIKESPRGIFLGIDKIKVVTNTTETIYSIEDFLELEFS